MLIERIILEPLNDPVYREIDQRMLSQDLLSPAYFQLYNNLDQPNEYDLKHPAAYSMVVDNFTLEKFIRLWGIYRWEELPAALAELYLSDLQLVVGIHQSNSDSLIMCKTGQDYDHALIYWKRFEEDAAKYEEIKAILQQMPDQFLLGVRINYAHTKIKSQQMFIQQLVPSEEDYLSLADFYQEYVDWCQAENIVPGKISHLLKFIPEIELFENTLYVNIRHVNWQNRLREEEVLSLAKKLASPEKGGLSLAKKLASPKLTATIPLERTLTQPSHL